MTGRLIISMLLACTATWSCGGGQASGGSTNTPESQTSDSEGDYASDDFGGDASEEAPVQNPCADGSCTSCGDNVCLEGFFCDEQAQACSWLPQCADDFSCSCLKQTLTDCSCSEREGGVYVSCE